MSAVPTAAALLGLRVKSPGSLHDSILTGLPFSALTALLDRSGLDPKDVYAVLQLPARTLARRKLAGRLSADESEHLLRLADLYSQTLQMFAGHPKSARDWLGEKRPALGGHRPIDLARTTVGTERVTTLIGQLEHGVFV